MLIHMSNAFPQSFLNLVDSYPDENADPFYLYFYLRREDSIDNHNQVLSLYQFILPRRIIFDSNEPIWMTLFLQTVDVPTNRIVRETSTPVMFNLNGKEVKDWKLDDARKYWKHLVENHKYKVFHGVVPRMDSKF